MIIMFSKNRMIIIIIIIYCNYKIYIKTEELLYATLIFNTFLLFIKQTYFNFI